MAKGSAPRLNPRGGDRRGQRTLGGRPRSSMWDGLALLLLLLPARMYYLLPGGRPIPYSEFKELVKANQVERVTVGDQTIRGTLKSGPENQKQFTVTRVEDSKLTEELEAHGVKYEGEAVNRWLPDLLWLVPFLFII